MVTEESYSAIAIFADFNDVPKLVVAQRLKAPQVDYVVLPRVNGSGRGKLERMRDLLREQTGVYISPPNRIHRLREPIQFKQGRCSISMTLFYADTPRSLSAGYMKTSEPDKLTQWRWETISWLREKTEHKLFPESVFQGIIAVSRKYVSSWVGDIPRDTFDFPHSGLHHRR